MQLKEIASLKEKQDGKFTRVPCFSMEEASSIVDVVDSLRDHFTERKVNPEVSFWTLGTSSYLDYSKAHGVTAESVNALMADNFGVFYVKLFGTLARHFGVPVFSPPHTNYPGFHIFEGIDKLPRGVPFGGTIHRDYPHISSNFDFEFTNPMSFTVMLETPKNGASLNYWDDPYIADNITSNTFESVSPEMQQHLISKVKSLDYKVGEIVTHDGTTIHQIANMVDASNTDRRISLQGHGVLTKDGYVVYF